MKKSSKGRYTFLITVLLVVIAVFVYRLVQWQIVQSDYYENIAMTSASYTVATDAIRGEIYDKNGVDLAVNVTGYRVVINKLYVREDRLNEVIDRLLTVINECGEKWNDELPIAVDDKGNYSFIGDREDDIELLKSKDNLNMNPYSSAGECMERLIDKYECRSYDKKRQRDIISVRYNMERTGFSGSQPYVISDSVSEKNMSVIAERLQDEKSVTTESTAVRTYTNGSIAPHIVGVTGLISAEEYKELKDKGYGYTDILGKTGVESAFEGYLRGEGGERTYEVDSVGNINIISTKNSKPGDNVYLTLDARLQKSATKALAEAVKEANTNAKESGEKHSGEDCTGAAVVVLNVKDFSVLAAASYPGFDLSKYYTDYEKLSSDKRIPLYNRAFDGALAPGSTYKPMVASAALQEKVIKPDTTIKCESIYTKGGLRLRCMSYHDSINMYEAIEKSCNVYFAETGRLLGIDKMDKYAKRFGLGVRTGVEIGESSGTLAGPEFSREMGSEWYETSVSPAAIGQSDNQFTPLQLATYVATIANDGTRLKTHVVDRIVSYDGKKVLKTEPTVVEKVGIDVNNLKQVQKAMNMATSSYDALSDFNMQIAGKTGTAENIGSDHANFICYAPYDKPEIAIAVMVEHGGKSTVAVNVGKKILNAYFYGKGLQEIPETNKDGTVGEQKNKN